ncbi:MAG: peptide chain release factor 1 [Alphaproteobacteria bacterium]|nr:peptide chain release factor 1 [Alphaproteobacteria bacterium]
MIHKRAAQILEKKETLEQKLIQSSTLSREEIVEAQKKLGEISDIAAFADHYLKVYTEQQEALKTLEESTDPEWSLYLEEELKKLKSSIALAEQDLRVALLPKDAADERNAILEVRAGTGGDEAALFAGDLLRMYIRYATIMNWKTEMMSCSETEMGGIKEAIILVKGKNVFANLKFESGGHRVQRVPETESQGRIHTSAATVAVLPEAVEVDIAIEMSDLRIDVYRSSGPGGQSVNTTDSAVRITHLPTGVVVQQQDEKSQHKNKEKAMKILRSRLYERERQRLADERDSVRQQHVGTGDRSDRIRTYNFPQDRFVDHRINKRFNDLNAILSGEKLGEITKSLLENDRAMKLLSTTE